jgi:hypothetical protein
VCSHQPHSAPLFNLRTVHLHILYEVRIEHIVTDFISSVNTVQQATIDEAVFSTSSAPCSVLVTDQELCLTCDTCFLCGMRHATVDGLLFSVSGPCRENITEYGIGN